jgi:hypothetical protein
MCSSEPRPCSRRRPRPGERVPVRLGRDGPHPGLLGLPLVGRGPLGLLPVGRALAVGSSADRRLADGTPSPAPPGPPRRLRGAADPRRRADGRWHPGRAQAGGAADASGRDLGAGASQARSHENPRARRARRRRRASVSTRRAERALDPDASYLRSWQRVAVSGRRPGRLLAADRRLEHGRSHARRSGRRPAAAGRRPAPAGARTDSPQRPQ